MPLTLRFQSTGMVPGSGAPIEMRGSSLTIGRGPENDVVLPDPDRVISKRHCVVEDHNGNIVVVDLSTNGTFLNYGKIPLGNTPTPLNDGDVLILGGYELVVDFGAADAPSFEDALAPPVGEGPVSHGNAGRAPNPLDLLDDLGPRQDFLDDLLGGSKPSGPSSVKRADPADEFLPPLPEDEDILGRSATPAWEGPSVGQHGASASDHFAMPNRAASVIPDDWDEDFLSPSPKPPAARAPVPQPPAAPPPVPPQDPLSDPLADPLADLLGATAPPEAPPRPVPPPPPVAPPPVPPPVAMRPVLPQPPVAPVVQPIAHPAPPPAASVGTPGVASRAFFGGLGLDDMNLSEEELVATMARLGSAMRLMIEGLREILMTRTAIKSEFRIEQTMVSSAGNNPLKFAITPEMAVEALVRPKGKGFLDSTTAITQALEDIKAHEVAMVSGMEAALKGVLKRLDPRALEGKIDATGGFSNLLKGKKARYWETYEKMYAQISDEAENDFHELFSREFARAYKEQLEKLK